VLKLVFSDKKLFPSSHFNAVIYVKDSICYKNAFHVNTVIHYISGGSQCDLSCEIFFSFSFSSVFTDIFPFQLCFSFCKFFRFSFSSFYF